MQLTTKETTELVAALATLTSAITDVTTIINAEDEITDHVECGPELVALRTAMDGVTNKLPTETSGGTGAAATTVSGAAAFRAKVEAGYDEP